MVKNIIQTVNLLVILFVALIAGCSQKSETQTPETRGEVVDTGILVVESSPSNAHVYIDGKLKGETPLTLYNLPVGDYSLVVKKEGYADFENAVAIKVGKTEEIDAELAQLQAKTEEKKPVEESKPAEQQKQEVPKGSLNKINLSSFAMYYDFDKIEFSELRADGSDLFSRKYDNYVHFTALTPTKINVVNKPISEIEESDCIVSDMAVAPVFSGQTLCVQTGAGKVVAVGAVWDKMPTELELVVFN